MSPKKNPKKKKAPRKTRVTEGKANPSRRKWVPVALVAGVVLVLAFVLLNQFTGTDNRPALKWEDPPMVSLTNIETIAREDIQRAYDYLDQNPFSGEAWGELGKYLFAYGFKIEAAECFDFAARYQPSQPLWDYYAGVCFYPADIQRSVQFLEKAVAGYEDQRFEPRLRLGSLLVEKGEPERAIEHLNKVLETKPDDPIATLGLARAYLNADRNEEALELLERIKENRFTGKSAHQLLSSLYFRSGRVKEAERAAFMAQNLPDDQTWEDGLLEQLGAYRKGRKAWLNHAESLMRKGDFNEASTLVEKLVREYPNDEGTWLFKGRMLLARRDYKEAEVAFRREIQNQPGTVEARVQLAVTLMYQGLHQEAVLVLKEAIGLEPGLAEAHFNLGLCHMQMGQTQEALIAYQNAIRFKPNMIDSHIGLANILASQNNFSEAAKTLEQAKTIDSNDQRISDLLKKIHQNSGGQY